MMDLKNVADSIIKNVSEASDKVKDLSGGARDTAKKAVGVAKSAGHNLEGFIKHKNHK